MTVSVALSRSHTYLTIYNVSHYSVTDGCLTVFTSDGNYIFAKKRWISIIPKLS